MTLTEKQIEYFKSDLESMKEEVYQHNHNRDENMDSEQLKRNDNHMGDSATAEYEHEKELTLKQSDEELLDEINQALRRIEVGSYGKCIDTGKNISIERLEAIPYAKRTIEAQREYDQQKNLPDDSVNTKRDDSSETIEQIKKEQEQYGR